MRNILLFLLPLMLFSSFNNPGPMDNMIVMPLDQHWQFRQSGAPQWLEASVPGTVHTDLMDNNLIPDPFYGTNERDLQWIDKEDWEYRCTFEAGPELLAKENVELVCHGLDTFAEVFLNDVPLISADNMFRSWQVSCKEQLRPGTNSLLVIFRSPIRIGLEKLAANGYPLPASNDQSENGGLGDKKVSVFTRKAGYHFGWDWGPRLVTSGIWRPVELRAWDRVRIDDVHVIQQEITSRKASLSVEVTLVASRDCEVRITAEIPGQEVVSSNFNITAGTHSFPLDLSIDKPEWWWPNGMGKAERYAVQVRAAVTGNQGMTDVDHREVMTGLRTVRLVQEPDKSGDGRSFYFEVNGLPVFARGANYIPNDVFLTRVRPEDYERVVRAAADANMNMLRVWGGGIYENDLFYELCDRYGIMVWQDFMYACSMYPGDDAFLDNARIEAEENIRRLRNHPSIVLWCGNNEIEVAWAEYEEGKGWGWKERYTEGQRKEIWNNYDTLFHHILPGAVEQYHPDIAYWHSSPSAGMGQLAGYENRSGDMHYWGVWHGQHPFSDYRKYKARFMSEYGFQSFPELNTVAAYAPSAEWDIESEVMAHHQRSGIGNLRIRQYMEEDYQVPEDFEHFLYVSQLLQAEGIKTAIKSHRTEKPYCMGSLYWQLNDCWPVASWSGIDYYGRWKAMHYFVRDAFRETMLASFIEQDSVRLSLVTENVNSREGLVKIKLIDFSGKVLWQHEKGLAIPGDRSIVVYEGSVEYFSSKNDLQKSLLVAELYIGDDLLDQELIYFVKPRHLSLEDAELHVRIEETKENYVISLQSPALARNVFLSTEMGPVAFSSNFFDLLPGVEKVVTCPKIGDRDLFERTLKIITLNETFR